MESKKLGKWSTDLGSDGAAVKKGAKREREAGEIEIKCAPAVGCVRVGDGGGDNGDQRSISAPLASGLQRQ